MMRKQTHLNQLRDLGFTVISNAARERNPDKYRHLPHRAKATIMFKDSQQMKEVYYKSTVNLDDRIKQEATLKEFLRSNGYKQPRAGYWN